MIYCRHMKYLVLVLSFIFLPSALSFAQTEAPDLTITAIPSDPLPGQSIQLQVVSFGANLNFANVVWRQDTRIIDSGVGKTRTVVTAPAAGVTSNISVSISGSTVPSASTAFLLRSAGVDLLWESVDSYTPPFYKGKAMPSVGTIIRATAVASTTAPKTLQYTWYRNGTLQPNYSGTNRASFYIKKDDINVQESIKVTAASSSFSSSTNAVITPKTPSLVLYQKNEGFIDYSHGSTRLFTTGQPGIVLRFEPYFFSSLRGIMNDLSFDVSTGEQRISGQANINEFRLSRPDNGGEVPLRVIINNASYSSQTLDRIFSLIFS